MSSLNHHLSDGELLHFADGEMPGRDRARVEAHLATCWECRTQLEELQKTIGECVRYRRAVSDSRIVSPPKPWFDIERQFAELDASAARGWFSRAWLRWAALAASAIGVWALVQQFRPPQVRPPADAQVARDPVASKPVPATAPFVPLRQEKQAVQRATASEELQVFAALRRLDADLGDPIDVTRDDRHIIVSGVGIDGDLERRIEAELRGIPRVEVRFSDPPEEIQQPAAGSTAAISADAAELQSKLEQQLGGRAAFDHFADQVLSILEMVMSRSHAIRRLAERFPPAVESRLNKDDRLLLMRLRREHAVALNAHITAVDQRMTPLLLELGATPPPVSPPSALPWQSDVPNLLQEARGLENALAVMLGGASTDRSAERLPSEALASLKTIREKAEWYVKGTAELR